MEMETGCRGQVSLSVLEPSRSLDGSTDTGEKEGIRVIPDPERPKSGEKVFVLHRFGQSRFSIGRRRIEGVVLHPNGQRENLRFTPDEEGPGGYLASFKAGNRAPSAW